VVGSQIYFALIWENTDETERQFFSKCGSPEAYRVKQVIEPKPNDRQCPCGCELTEICDSISEQLDIIPAQVLKEPGKSAQSQSYMWVQHGGPPSNAIIHYHNVLVDPPAWRLNC
jgi:hypothetical protein